MIALIDYGIGNLRSVEKALESVGADVLLTADPTEIARADKVVLPGVGAFGDGMSGLKRLGLIESLRQVVERKIPLLGICLGMQLLFETSDELGSHKGLGFLPGRVRRFPPGKLKIPQTGWNQVIVQQETPLLYGLEPGSYAYFNHSYYCDPANENHVLARTEYGIEYASVIGQGPLVGVQFHPEKSQSVGLLMLKNFVERY